MLCCVISTHFQRACGVLSSAIYVYGEMADSPQGRDKPSRELIEELCLRFVVNKPLEDTK